MIKFEMPDLLYSEDDLAPFISAHTIQHHYNIHTQQYYTNTNELIHNTKFEECKSLRELISHHLIYADTKLFNNACQAWNHTFFWESMCSLSSHTEPSPILLSLIKRKFDSFDNMKQQFNKMANSHFGSGWCWLIIENTELKIVVTTNANTPATNPSTLVLLGLDLWEHAYYLDYPANKIQFIHNWWNLVNWNKVHERILQDWWSLDKVDNASDVLITNAQK